MAITANRVLQSSRCAGVHVEPCILSAITGTYVKGRLGHDDCLKKADEHGPGG